MSKPSSKTYEEILKIREQLQELNMGYWKDDNLFTWEWWLLVGLTIVPLVIWWYFLDKKRAYEIAFYGCMINISAVLLDDVGTSLLWWGYPIKLVPLVPPLLTADTILVPIVLMLVYQRYSSTWKSFLVANLISGAFIAFVFEPIFMWIGYYQLIKWKLIYSYFYYLTASSLARFIIIRIVR